MDNLEWLQNWYQQNCDGGWEHSYGVEIGTLDNPGWYVNIDLKDTQYADLQRPKLSQDRGENDWFNCSIVDGVFKGVGDSLKLNKIIQTLKEWIQED